MASNEANGWPQQDSSKTEVQGFLSNARKIGSMCIVINPFIKIINILWHYVSCMDFRINNIQNAGALCRAAYYGGKPTAIVDSFGLADEVEIQRFKDFLKRFGCELTSGVTRC